MNGEAVKSNMWYSGVVSEFAGKVLEFAQSLSTLAFALSVIINYDII